MISANKIKTIQLSMVIRFWKTVIKRYLFYARPINLFRFKLNLFFAVGELSC